MEAEDMVLTVVYRAKMVVVGVGKMPPTQGPLKTWIGPFHLQLLMLSLMLMLILILLMFISKAHSKLGSNRCTYNFDVVIDAVNVYF